MNQGASIDFHFDNEVSSFSLFRNALETQNARVPDGIV